MKRKPRVTILIPTYNNSQQLLDCITSILAGYHVEPMKIIVINNGESEVHADVGKDRLEVIKAPHNLGWESALKLGLKHVKTEFVMFMNDDTYVPISSVYWLKEMVRNMDGYSPRIGAIGPSSNVVMGKQNIFQEPRIMKFEVSFLIGFCILIRMEALEKAGGVDDTLHGGDDIDLSIRIRDAGYALMVRKDIFIWHHGFQTGEKLHGTPDKPGGWNSREMTDTTNIGLIQKHGLKKWVHTLYPGVFGEPKELIKHFVDTDQEGKLVRKFIKGKKIVDLGCGYKKTVENSIGVDRIPKGEEVPNLYQNSVADVVANVEDPLPFKDNSIDTIVARHILEHCIDVISTLKNWVKILKPGGRLIIAVPDESSEITINLNPEHVHVFTPKSMKTLLDTLGLKKVTMLTGYNTSSFLSVYEKEAKK